MTVKIMKDSAEMRKDWIDIYNRVIINPHVEGLAVKRTAPSEQEQYFNISSIKTPIFNVLLAAFALKLTDLEDELETLKREKNSSDLPIPRPTTPEIFPDVAEAGPPPNFKVPVESMSRPNFFQNENLDPLESENVTDSIPVESAPRVVQRHPIYSKPSESVPPHLSPRTDDDSTDDEDFYKSLDSSPSVFNLKSFTRSPSPRKKKKNTTNLKLCPEKVEVGEDQAQTSTQPQKPPVVLNLKSQLDLASPEVVLLRSDPNSEEPLDLDLDCDTTGDFEQDVLLLSPVKTPYFNNKKTKTEEKKTISANLNESVDIFNSSIPLKDNPNPKPPIPKNNRFEITVSKKKKEPWIDIDLLSTSKTRNTKTQSSAPAPKSMKQTKLDTLTKKMCQKPPTKVDLSTLKEYKGGSLSAQTSNNFNEAKTKENDMDVTAFPLPLSMPLPISSSETSGFKRKSDESAENKEKREKVDLRTTPLKSFSQCIISPIKVYVNSEQSNVTPPQSPRTGPSTSTQIHILPQPQQSSSTVIGKSKAIATPSSSTVSTKKVKPLSPISKDNIMKTKNPESPRPRIRAFDKVGEEKQVEKGGDGTGEGVTDFTFNLLRDFDEVPSNKPPSPNFRYKEPVVRKKNERAQLRGWDCDECRAYYEALQSQMDETEIQRIKDRCSRHRGKHQPVSNTPENFWCTYLPSTEELYADGYIRVGTPFTPKAWPERKRYNSDSEQNGDESMPNE